MLIINIIPFSFQPCSTFVAVVFAPSLNRFEVEHQPTWSRGAQSNHFQKVDIRLAQILWTGSPLGGSSTVGWTVLKGFTLKICDARI
jgi:hypothetical protein